MAEVTCLKCGKKCKSLQGWKTHSSSVHGGYDEDDLAAVAGIGGPTPGGAKERMESFANNLPDDSVPVTIGADGTLKEAVAAIPLETERRIKATPKKLKKILGGIPAKILETQKIELDSEDRDALEESAEFLADVFGFEFSVPESKVKVESRFWALAWVAGITALIFLKHRSGMLAKLLFEKKKDEETTVEN